MSSTEASKVKTKSVIRDHIAEPWLTAIVEGSKTHEGRLRGGSWSKLSKGQRVVVANEAWSEVELEVTEVIEFKDFGEAWDQLGVHLIPKVLGVENADGARDLYSKIPKAEYTTDRINQRGGVVAVGVKVVRAVPAKK